MQGISINFIVERNKTTIKDWTQMIYSSCTHKAYKYIGSKVFKEYGVFASF